MFTLNVPTRTAAGLGQVQAPFFAARGLGQTPSPPFLYSFFDNPLCIPVNLVIKPLGSVGKLLSSTGCCTAAGQTQLNKAIADGVKQVAGNLDPTTQALLTGAATADIRSCLCSGVSCAGVPGATSTTTTTSGTTIALVIGGVAAVGLLAWALTRKPAKGA